MNTGIAVPKNRNEVKTHGRKNFDSYLRSKNLKVIPTYEFNSYSLCKELIKNGFGIGIGNPIHYINDEDLFILNTDFELPKRTFNNPIRFFSVWSIPQDI